MHEFKRGNEMINVTRSSMPPYEEFCEEIKELWDTHWLTNMGDKHKEFQKRITEYMEVPNIELLTNGHMALELVIQSFGFGEGEVITTPYTFASTTHAIVRNGLKPVFCDINHDDFTIDVSKMEKLITKDTKAIIPVHVYGNICNVEEISRIADKYGLKVIYDAAHSFGEKYKGVSTGNFGDASCFSFHATKVFNTIEGGAVAYKDPQIGKRLYCLKNFGIDGPEVVSGIGANAKMNEFCASMGICNLRHVDEEIAKRKRVYEHYRDRLSEIKGIRLNAFSKDVCHNYAYFPIIVEDEYGEARDDLFGRLAEKGYGARKYFYPITSAFDCYKDRFNASDTPIALETSRRVLTLPFYADLPFEVVDGICDVVATQSPCFVD